ncbi:MAG: helix-hairpin-helix domain-containing protein [Caldilineaceae bacterium]|nr:helix-hairpin-helix domain-containing protein [Caldilineaceae bacterium]
MINREQQTEWQMTGKALLSQWETFYQEHRSTIHTVGIIALAGATGTAIGFMVGKGLFAVKGVAVAKASTTQAMLIDPTAAAATLKGAVTMVGNTATQGAALVDKVTALLNTLSTNAIPLTAGAVGGSVAGVGVTRSQVRQVQAKLDEQAVQTAAAQAEVARVQSELATAVADLAGWQLKTAPPIADRLEDIRGIGQVMAQRLLAAGIVTFADLAAQTPAQIRAIIGTGRAAAMMNPEAWIAEAQQRVAASTPPPNTAEAPPSA